MRHPKQHTLLVAGILAGLMIIVTVAMVATGQPAYDKLVHFPLAAKVPSPTPTPTPTPTPSPTPPRPDNEEFRGMWVTRFDWTTSSGADPGKIDEIVNNAALAGFNVILFQVRGEADAYYTPGLEPWAKRLTGTWGQNPGWDPLASMIQKAHARGIQVHAYINIYPVVLGCNAGPTNTNPQHFYYKIRDAHGESSDKLRGLQWNSGNSVICSTYDYQRASPASLFVDDHLLGVGADLLNRYDIDGLHLDHIRYASGASCDPVSLCRYNGKVENCGINYSCPLSNPDYKNWQRAQVNGTVSKFYDLVANRNDKLWLSAAVWHTYIDYWGWGYSEGYHDYYQDSKAWVQGDYIDGIMPMLYSSSDSDPNTGTFRQSRWQTLVANFQQDRGNRLIIPGIGSNHYNSFDEIAARIEIARNLGTAGHSIFSYGGLNQKGYFDDLAAGPYSEPATVPKITWHQ